MRHTFLLLFTFFELSSYGQSFYDLNTIQTIQITFSQSNWDALLDAAEPSGNYVMAESVSLNGTVFDSVGVKYKGNSSYNANQVKNPFHIELDTYKDQDYQGYTDIKLSNVAKDPSFLREVLSYKILRQYMHAPESNYAKVYVNGTYIGLYSNDEAISKKFVNKHFNSKTNAFFNCSPPNGAGQGSTDLPVLVFYGNDSTDYYLKYEIKSGYGWKKLIALTDTIDNNFSGFENIMDEDRAIWMLAFDNAFVNLDSYMGQFRQNYYLYQDDEGIFNPVVWDLNESFGGFAATGSGNLTSANAKRQMSHVLHQSDANWPLIQKILNNATYKKMYVAHMKTMLAENVGNGTYATDALALQNLISADVNSDGNKFFSYSNFISNLNNDVSSGPQSYIGLTSLMNGRNTYLMGLADFTATAPAITNITPSNSNPPLNSTVTITAAITNTNNVILGYRYDESKHFAKLTMYDDGAHNDGASGDGIFGADIPVNASFIQYYIYAENSAAGMFSPQRAEHEFYSLLASISTTNASDVVINEVMASNAITVADNNGDYDDWIELYNKGVQPIDISGYFLTDNPTSLNKWAVPSETTIAPDSYLIIWADEDSSQGAYHANFKLSASGESLYLLNPQLEIADTLEFNQQVADMGYARVPNGIGSFAIQSPTFSANNSTVSTSLSKVYKSDFSFRVYPNPVGTKAVVVIDGDYKEREMVVTNLLGETIYKTDVSTGHVMDVTPFAPGIYFIKIDNKTKRLVVAR